MDTTHDRHESSIRELESNSRNAVIRVFATAIGASSTFAEAGVSGAVLDLETFSELLALREWPSAETTTIELAYLSQPIPGDEVRELDGYSVFWATSDDGFEMWIGRTPLRPLDERAYLRNVELWTAIVEAYGFYLSYEHRRDYKRALLKWRIMQYWFPATLLLLAPVVIGIVVLAQRGWSVEGFKLLDVSPIGGYFLGAFVTYSLFRWGRSTIVRIGYGLLIFGATAFLAIAFDRAELTQLLGLSTSFAAGLYVTAWKNWDLLWLTGREIADGRFWSVYIILATLAVVTSTTFGAYQALTRAVDGTFLGGNPFLVVPVVVVVVLALAEYVRSQIAK